MADTAELYDQTRSTLSELVRGLTDEELQKKVPATPGWSIRDIISHLSGDAASVRSGDFPEEFFASFGDDAAVALLNGWTTEHIERRKDMSLEDVLAEWEEGSAAVTSMMRGETPWPGNIPAFADRVLLTDIGAHQQDIYGALGIERDREGPLVKMGTAGYVVVMGFRLPAAGLAPLRVEAGDSVRASGEGEPGATVRSSRFEMFRALSGRRSPEQIKAYGWDGDPEPYIDYFYPYGKREEALVE
jgi:uncharacterized protein (TIGR03083 family)